MGFQLFKKLVLVIHVLNGSCKNKATKHIHKKAIKTVYSTVKYGCLKVPITAIMQVLHLKSR